MTVKQVNALGNGRFSVYCDDRRCLYHSVTCTAHNAIVVTHHQAFDAPTSHHSFGGPLEHDCPD